MLDRIKIEQKNLCDEINELWIEVENRGTYSSILAVKIADKGVRLAELICEENKWEII